MTSTLLIVPTLIMVILKGIRQLHPLLFCERQAWWIIHLGLDKG